MLNVDNNTIRSKQFIAYQDSSNFNRYKKNEIRYITFCIIIPCIHCQVQYPHSPFLI